MSFDNEEGDPYRENKTLQEQNIKNGTELYLFANKEKIINNPSEYQSIEELSKGVELPSQISYIQPRKTPTSLGFPKLPENYKKMGIQANVHYVTKSKQDKFDKYGFFGKPYGEYYKFYNMNLTVKQSKPVIIENILWKNEVTSDESPYQTDFHL